MVVTYLVVDSGAFIKNSPVHEYAENVYTVSGAIKEIKDKATLQRLQFLPYKLHVKEPLPEACKYILEFSKKTGDFGSLSATDLQIIALTYQLEKEYVGTDHLNKEPSCKVTGKPCFSDNGLSGFYYPKKHQSEDDELTSETDSNETKSCGGETISEDPNTTSNESNESELPIDNNTASKEVIEEDKFSERDDNSEDESSWITPNNIGEIQKKFGSLALVQDSTITVACVTTDFSIQNVLLQMGLHVISVDGILIKEARVFILRCYACFKTTNNIAKQFCPNCGNKTLKKVAVSVNEDGTKNIHINLKKRINIRGTRYSLPLPKGGKHAVNPVLCEDQPIPHNRPTKFATTKIDVFSPDYEASSSPFAVNDVYSRAANLGIRANHGRQQRKNPNEWSKRTGNKKKK